jgi:hypothetical protein
MEPTCWEKAGKEEASVSATARINDRNKPDFIEYLGLGGGYGG